MKKLLAQCKKCGATDFEVKANLYHYEKTNFERFKEIWEDYPKISQYPYCPNCKMGLSYEDIEFVKEI